MKKKNFNYNVVLFCLFLILLFVFPTPSKSGIANALLLCGRIIIPSLFSVTVCIIFLMNTNFYKILTPFSKITKLLFGFDSNIFALMLFSFVGGYPIGAKILSNAVKNKSLEAKNASSLLCFFVNAGPAFIIGAVGEGIYNSTKIGYILFLSHILSSFFICFALHFKNKNTIILKPDKVNHITFADNFVLSVAEASQTLINICSFIIMFGSINSYFIYLSTKHNFFEYFTYIFEITNAVNQTKNIYLISFLLGFGGLSLWFQIFSLCKSFKINIKTFILSRFTHGILSSLITFLIIKIFKISIPVLSVQKNFNFHLLYSKPILTISLFLTAIVFVFSLNQEKCNCKILDDVV